MFFFDSDEIDGGCEEGPSLPLSNVLNGEDLDNRLCVTESLFTLMIADVANIDLANTLDAYQDYVTGQEVSWQVHAVIKPQEEEDDDDLFEPSVRIASGIAVDGQFAYISDSTQHIIFKVNLLQPEENTKLFVGRVALEI